jgi:outer membrane receptor protein involved in Fe transport
MFQAMTDVERVEVIRGPGGAINGRMAAAGSINIVTKDPDFEKIDFNGGITFGDYDTLNANAALNLPLKLTGLDLPAFIENLSFRIAASRLHHDEYIHNQNDEPVSGNQDAKLGRVKMKWQPIESLTLNALYSVTKDKSNPEMRVPPINTKQTFPPFPGEPHPDDPWLNATGRAASEREETEDYTESVEAVYSTSFATFTGKWSHSWRPQRCQPGDANCYEGDIGQKDYELRIASPDESRIRWMVGANKYNKKEYAGPDREVNEIDDETEVNIGFNSLYGDASWYRGMGYYTDEPTFDPNDPTRPWAIPGVPSITADSVYFHSDDQTRPIDSYAYFGNITIPLFEDKHRFTFGLRKTVEEKKRAAVYGVFKFDEDGTNGGLPHFEFVNNTFGDTSKGTWIVDNYYLEYVEEPHIMETTDDPVDITVGWEYDWNTDVMVYFNVNTGFKPGGISSEGVPNTYYEPEKNTTYAAGVKSRLFGNTLQLNVEAFVMDYDKLQLDTNSSSSVSFTAGNGITYTQAYMFNKKIVNLGKTRNYGLTVDYDWLITGSDRLKGNLEIKNNKYGELRFDLGQNAMPPGNPRWFVLTGRQMPFAPKFSFYGSYSHIFTFGNYILTPRADIRYSTEYPLFSEWYWALAGVETMQPAYFKYDGYLNFGPTSGAWQLNAYVKNISEEVVRDLGMMFTTVQPPRTMGVGLSFRF